MKNSERQIHTNNQCSTQETVINTNSSKIDTVEQIHADERLGIPPTPSQVAVVTQRRCNVAESFKNDAIEKYCRHQTQNDPNTNIFQQ